jgi:hypothetical protein
MSSEERSAAARQLAEAALVILYDAIDRSSLRLIVLGGLVPETLAAPDRLAHLGTTDVDILIAVHVRDLVDARPVEQALEAVGAYPDAARPDGWRWRIPLGEVRVKVEFLCDDDSLSDQHAVLLPGCARLTALNLRGTGYVARDFHLREITVGDRTVTVCFAGLEGYLLAKAHAARQRGLEKDYYDFAYVLLHNQVGGPGQAAPQLLSGVFASEVPTLRTLWLEIDARASTARPASAPRRTQPRRCLSTRRRPSRCFATTLTPPSPSSSAPSHR